MMYVVEQLQQIGQTFLRHIALAEKTKQKLFGDRNSQALKQRRHQMSRASFGRIVAILLSVGSLLLGSAAMAQSVDVNKSFNPVQIQDSAPFNKSRLSIVINNTDPQTTIQNLNLTDNLPAGVVIATPPNISTACGATVNAVAGGTSLKLTDGLILNGGFCTFQVDVVSSVASVYTNTIPAGVPLSQGEVVRQTASASLTVIRRDATPPQVTSKTFTPNSIVSGQSSQFTITLKNNNLLPLMNTNLNDSLPAGMVLASPPNASTTCSGVVNASAGGSTLGMTGATIPGDGTCTVTATVVGTTASPTPVNLINAIKPGDVTSLNGQISTPLANTGTTNGTLAVSSVPTDVLSKSFSTGSPYVGQAFTMTWTIYNNTPNRWPNLAVTDNLPAGMLVYATSPQPSSSCGGSVIAPTTGSVKLSGATLAAGSSCTITIRVVAPAGTTGQVLTNTIPANSLSTNGTTIPHNPASASVTLIAPAPGTGPSLSSVVKSYVQLIAEAALTQASPLPAGHAPATVTGGLIDMTLVLNKSVPGGGVNQDLTPLHLTDDWTATAPNFSFFSLVSNSCGGTVTSVVGAKLLNLDNGVIAQDASSCTIKVRLKADSVIVPAPPANGTPQSNSATGCVSAVTGNTACPGVGRISNTAPALVVGNPPLFPFKSFSPTTIPINGTSRAGITIQNPASTTRYNVAAVDTLPAQLIFATPLNPVMTCANNGTTLLNYQINGKTITFMIPQLLGFAGSASPPQCSINFSVAADTSATAGSAATNSILANAVTATDSNGTFDPSATNVKPADANLNFSNPLSGPQISKNFNPVTVFQRTGTGPINNNVQGTGVGELSTLTLQIINSNVLAGSNFTGTNLNDALPAGVVIAPNPNVTRSNCGSPTITAVAGGTSVAISNATVSASSSCVFTVDVVGTVKGNQINNIPANSVQTAQAVSNPLPANATLTVLATTPISALFKDVVKTGTTTSVYGQAIAPGENLTYILKLSNPGYLSLSLKNDVKFVQDILPAGVTFVSATGGDIAGTLSGNKVLWDFSGSAQTLAAGQFITLQFNVKVNPNTVAPVINTATTSTIGNCGPYDGAACTFNPPNASCTLPVNPLSPTTSELANPAICHPVFVPIVPTFKIVKTHVGNFIVGQPAAYNLAITNNGGSNSNGVMKLSDLLPAGMSLTATTPITSASGTISNVVTAGQVVNFDFTPNPVIAVGATVNITLNVNVTAAAAGNVTNYVNISGGGDPYVDPPAGPGCIDPNHCSSDPTVINIPGSVIVTKALTSANGQAIILGQKLKAGDVLLYTITMSNPGGIDVTGYAVSDNTPTATTYLSSSDGGATSGATVNWSGLTVPAGASKVVTVSFQAVSPLPANVTSISNVAYHTGDTPPACPSTSPACVVYPPVPSLKVVKSHSGTFAVGGIGVYTLALSGTSATLSTAPIQLIDLLPAGMSLAAVNPITSSDGTISNVVVTGQQVTFTFTSNAAITNTRGANITMNVNVGAAAAGNTVNYVSINGGGDLFARVPPGTGCTDGGHCAKDSVTVGSLNGLTLTKTGPATITVGGADQYQLTVKNTGATVTTGALKLIDNLPIGMSLNGAIVSGQGSVANVVTTGTAASGFVIAFDFTPTTPLPAGTGTASLNVPVLVGALVKPGAMTNYASVGAGGDVYNNGLPPTPDTNCSDPHCAKATTNITATNALLSIVKTVNKSEAELGDTVVYTIAVTNIGNGVVNKAQIIDTLPRGFRLENNSSHVTGGKITAPTGAPGPVITYEIDTIAPGVTVTITYRSRLGVGSAQSDGINRAIAHCPYNSNLNCSNEGRAKVRVNGGVFSTDACIAGMIFVDCNGNQIKDYDEVGIPGVRLYLEDGTFLISDVEGKYSYCGLSPKTHVIKVDQTTLPRGSRLVSSSNRNVGDANSLFIDLKNGELQRADFIEGSCSNPVLEQVKARRTQGEIGAPHTEKQRGVPLKFEGKAPDYPQEGTESADQMIVKPRINKPDDIPRAQQPKTTNSERDTPLQQLDMRQGDRHE